MTGPRFFSAQDPSLGLITKVSELLKKKFDLFGEVEGFPITENDVQKVHFQLEPQGINPAGGKSRDELVKDFLRGGPIPYQSVKASDPTSRNPEFRKQLSLTINLSDLESLKVTLVNRDDKLTERPEADFPKRLNQ